MTKRYMNETHTELTTADYCIALAIACLGFMAFWGIAFMLLSA